ncbi:polymorphic toxin type 30 domain-containing protein [Streptomyces hawaiiensis]|uniref:polymorphic toxin type 30 domain-containing protein n=1 Tax=Streptomyces hawaiiensis TaxID=67305 RepID=UPI003652448F
MPARRSGGGAPRNQDPLRPSYAGNLYHRQVHNPNSPHYNPDAAHATHIPWPAQFPLPYW